MGEVGQKAMSAAINDVGSAISAINALTRILIDSKPDDSIKVEETDFISIAMFDVKEFIYSTFAPIARDSMSNIELNQRMIKCLSMIQKNVEETELKSASEIMAIEILKRCICKFEFEPDRQLLKDEFKQCFPHLELPV